MGTPDLFLLVMQGTSRGTVGDLSIFRRADYDSGEIGPLARQQRKTPRGSTVFRANQVTVDGLIVLPDTTLSPYATIDKEHSYFPICCMLERRRKLGKILMTKKSG